MHELGRCFTAGYASLSAWADLLNRINVFPVVDGDTGTNLRISLAPFRAAEQDLATIPSLLPRCAIGNSGNIAAAFFREFAQAGCFADLAERAAVGREKAWLAVGEPCKGTMLSVFDSLAEILAKHTELSSLYPVLQTALRQAVLSSPEHLPELQTAGVVDSGALGMYIYFDGFFRALTKQEGKPESVIKKFAGQLKIRSAFLSLDLAGSGGSVKASSCCVDAVLQRAGEGAGSGDPGDKMIATAEAINALGESVVVLEDDSLLKVHIHTDEPEQLQQQLAAFGTLVHWDAEQIVRSHGALNPKEKPDEDPAVQPALHIVTDAAGSISRETAEQHGISLLDSYIVTGDAARPESLCDPAIIYSRQRKGGRVSTAQASS
ncbi:MAG: DAK2 domain-containing protein, partial [Candidatus Electrothrix sp. AR4]|nr:DAK2 domain-containing protein [Candidatus Electrothrix sp. AR4]